MAVFLLPVTAWALLLSPTSVEVSLAIVASMVLGATPVWLSPMMSGESVVSCPMQALTQGRRLACRSAGNL